MQNGHQEPPVEDDDHRLLAAVLRERHRPARGIGQSEVGRSLAQVKSGERGRHAGGNEVEPRARSEKKTRGAEDERGRPAPALSASHRERGEGRGQREGDHVALGMIPDDRDPEEKQVGRDGPDGDGHAEYGEPGRGTHSTILPRASSAGHLSPRTVPSMGP